MIYSLGLLDQCFIAFLSQGKFLSLKKSRGTPPAENVVELISWQESMKDTLEALSPQLSAFLWFRFYSSQAWKAHFTQYRYVVKNGSNVKIALLASMGNSLAAANQKLFKGRSAKLSLRPRSCLSSVSSSCSFKVMSFPTADSELNGSLTQSKHSVEAEGK